MMNRRREDTLHDDMLPRNCKSGRGWAMRWPGDSGASARLLQPDFIGLDERADALRGFEQQGTMVIDPGATASKRAVIGE